MNDPTQTPSANSFASRGAGFWSDVSLLSVAVIWGINIPLMKIGLEHINVFVFNAVRLTVSATVLASFALREIRQGRLPTWEIPWGKVCLYGVLAAGLYQLMFLLGVARTTSGNTALIMATVPMWTALLARMFLAERLKPIAWWGLVIALFGTIVVATQSGEVTVSRTHLLGNGIILAAALVWSGATVYSRPLLQQISPMQLSATAAVISLPLHWLMACNEVQSNLPALKSVSLWWILLFSGVLSSGLALPMWNFGVRQAGAAHAAVIQNLIPVVAILAAWISRGEIATPTQLVGGALILSGLVLMRRGRVK